eukprot:3317997-Amphidinium_carterae.1
MQSNGHTAINGYAYSTMVDSLPIENVIICGCTYMMKSLGEFLASDQGVTLTRASISHYESFYEVAEISRKRVISPEMLESLTQQGAN